jgi:hypothetical protein
MTPSTDPVVLPRVTPVRQRPWLTLVRPPDASSRFVQGALPLTFDLPSGLAAVPSTRVGSRPATWAVTDGIPAPHDWAARFLQAVLEVVSNERSITQLVRWTAPSVYDRIQQAQRHVAAARRDSGGRRVRHHVVSVHVHQVSGATAEIAARVAAGRRSRALAARLEFERERWTCTALDLG